MQRQKYLCLIWKERELVLMTFPNRQRMCSTAERKWCLYFRPLLVYTRSAECRVDSF
jgi:hypothetical protein